MKIIIPPIYERTDQDRDPFDLDSFDRSRFAQNLTRLFERTNDGLVITINSSWGDGKTSFVRLWAERLDKDDQFIPIYYDAFQNDFSNDPFLSIAALIHETLKQKIEHAGGNSRQIEQLQYLKDATKELAIELMLMSSGMLITSMTSGIVSIKGIRDFFAKSWNKLIKGVIDVDVDEKFESHIKAKSSIESYQTQLKKILNFDEEVDDKKIVFFVDELDRCRPDFAVQVIEKIKHLFNINNVFFVLTINKSQLLSTISSVYGVPTKDAFVYLQKFIHVETELPPIHLTGKKNAVEKLTLYLQELATLFELDSIYSENEFEFEKFAEFVSTPYLSLNPRAMERVFSLIALAVGSSNKVFDASNLKVVCIMSALKVGLPELYENWKQGDFNSIPDADYGKRNWEFLKEYFITEKRDTAANIFVVDIVSEICQILDVYKFPAEVSEAEFHVEGKSKAQASTVT